MFSSSKQPEVPLVKYYGTGAATAFVALLFATSLTSASLLAAAQHTFSVKEYDHFHDVLHPLEHEALPAKDYRRIRANAKQLVTRGRAIVKVGVPAGTSEDQKEAFASELKEFSQALNKFRADARRSNNARLRTSYSAVHDSFEMLVAMLPR
jgi:hypothetical protein